MLYTYSPFVTQIFLDTECLYKTGRLWKALDDVPVRDESRLAIYRLPKQCMDLHVDESHKHRNLYHLRGVAKSNELDTVTSVTIVVPNVEDDERLINSMKGTFLKLAQEQDIEIVLTENETYNANVPDFENPLYIHAIGERSKVLTCEPHLRSALILHLNSELKPCRKQVLDCLELDSYSQLPLLMGINMSNLKYTAEMFQTTTYIPSLDISPENQTTKPQVFFSGSVSKLVELCKDVLSKNLRDVQQDLYYVRFTSISPGKLRFIKKFCRTEIIKMMIKYQSFIGVTDEIIEFQAPSSVLLSTIIKRFTLEILQNITEVRIIMGESFKFTDEMIVPLLDSQHDLELIVLRSSDINNQMVVIGKNISEDNKKRKIYLADHVCSYLKHSICEHRLELSDNVATNEIVQLCAIFEIHPDYADFVSGKKNGKLTRIMENSNCLLKLERLKGDNNVYLSLISDTFQNFKRGVRQLIDELPAEESFYIPEVYHRPVIGSGGSIIQTTMRKHNVFIQFSNTFSLPQNKLSVVRYNNVIIRCPYKNKSGILLAKDELNSLVDNYNAIQPRILLKFSPGQYRRLLSKNQDNVIGNIEKNKNVHITIPPEEPSENHFLEVRGNESNVVEAAETLDTCVFSFEKEFVLDQDYLSDTEKINTFYQRIVVPLLTDMDIYVTFTKNMIRFTYDRSSKDVENATKMLVEYLNTIPVSIKSQKNRTSFIVESSIPDNETSWTPPPFTQFPAKPYVQGFTSSMPGFSYNFMPSPMVTRNMNSNENRMNPYMVSNVYGYSHRMR